MVQSEMTNNPTIESLRARLQASVHTILTHALGDADRGSAYIDDDGSVSWEWVGGMDAVDAAAVLGRTIPWITVEDVEVNHAHLVWSPSGPLETPLPGMEPLSIYLRRMP